MRIGLKLCAKRQRQRHGRNLYSNVRGRFRAQAILILLFSIAQRRGKGSSVLKNSETGVDESKKESGCLYCSLLPRYKEDMCASPLGSLVVAAGNWNFGGAEHNFSAFLTFFLGFISELLNS